MEVVDHDLGLESDGVVVAFDITAEFPVRLLPVELGVALHLLDELVVALDRGVVPQHVQDEALLDRLFHGVAVEGPVLDRAVGLRLRLAEDLQRLVFWRSGEGEVARVREHLLRLHPLLQGVVDRVLGVWRRLAEGLADRSGGFPALAGVRLVDDDGKVPPAVPMVPIGPDLVQDEGELLHRGDDDLLTALDEPAQVARSLGVADGRAHLGELLDGVPDLPVEDGAVGDDDDGVEDQCAVLLQPDQLMGEPGDGVRLAATGRMLDQVAPAGAVLTGIRQHLAHHVELVEARPDLNRLLAAGLLVLDLDHLGVVLQDVGESPAGEDALPQVVGLEPLRVGRIASPIVPTQVEGQEPGGLALELRTEAHLVIVHGEMHDAAAKLEELLARVAVELVLLDGVLDGLLGQAVLQLEGGHRQAVDEEAQVEGELGLVAAVAQLPGDAEAVGRVALLGLGVARGRCAVEEVEVERTVLDPSPQHVDGATLGDLALEAGQELAPGRPVLVQVQGLGHLGLCLVEEGRKLGQVDAVLAVIVLRRAADPTHPIVGVRLVPRSRGRGTGLAGGAGERGADQPFQAVLGGIRGHRSSPEPVGFKHPSIAVLSAQAASARTSATRSGCDHRATVDSGSTKRKSSSAQTSAVSSKRLTKWSASGPAAR